MAQFPPHACMIEPSSTCAYSGTSTLTHVHTLTHSRTRTHTNTQTHTHIETQVSHSEDINKEAIQLQLNNGVVNQTTNNHVRIHNPQLNSKSNEQATNNPTWLLAHVWEQWD